MSASLTKRSVDHSTANIFSFSFYCDCCGKSLRSPAVKFQYSGFSAIEHEEARQPIWAQEHKTAFDVVNLEAHLIFNRCEKFGKRVCDDCFDYESDFSYCKKLLSKPEEMNSKQRRCITVF